MDGTCVRQGDRRLALECVVGILEDGEVEVTEVSRRAAPKDGQRGQWEQRVVSQSASQIMHACIHSFICLRCPFYFLSVSSLHSSDCPAHSLATQ